MAEENDDGQERTQEATAKRKQELREQGQVPRSRELNMLLILAGSLTLMLMLGTSLMSAIAQIMQQTFSAGRETLLDFSEIILFAKHAMIKVGLILLPFFIVLFLIILATPALLGGWNFSMKALEFKLERMAFFAGLKRMLSLQALFGLIKPLAKFILVLFFGYIFYRIKFPEMMALNNMALPVAIVEGVKLMAYVILGPLCGVLLIVAMDVPFQWWQYSKKLKMSMEEIKKEMKESEGSPELKGKIRQTQREIAKRRMMADVPQANVVITNPTHFAVALRYDDSGEGAPVVVAKGTDLVAGRIREIAMEHQVIIFSAPLLARALYYHTDIGKEIPAGLYIAVAKVLAYVYQLKRYDAGYAPQPHEVKLEELPIPQELHHDA